MPDKIILPNEFLAIAEEELLQGKSVKVLADGESMYPFIKGARDTAEIEPLPSETPLETWRVYMFRHKGRYIIHRFIGTRNGSLVMMGDGNLIQKEIVSREDVIGVLSRIHKKNGGIKDCSSTKWLLTGNLWAVLSPVRRYILGILRRLNK